MLKDKPEDFTVMLTLHTAVLLWGFSGLFGKWVMVDSLTIVFWRLVVAFFTMIIFVYLKNRILIPKFSASMYLKQLCCGFIIAIHWVTFYELIKLSTVGIGYIFYASFSFFVILLEPFLFRYKPKLVAILLTAIGIFGLYFATTSPIMADIKLLWFFGIISTTAYAFLSLANRTILAQTDPFQSTMVQFFFGALALLPFAPESYITIPTNEFLKIVLMGIFCTAIAHTIYFWSLRYISATKGAMLVSLTPLYGIMLAAALLRELPDPIVLGGAAIVIMTSGLASILSVYLRQKALDKKLNLSR